MIKPRRSENDEKEFVGIRIEKNTWVKLKVAAAVKERSITDLADEIIRDGLAKYIAEIDQLVHQ